MNDAPLMIPLLAALQRRNSQLRLGRTLCEGFTSTGALLGRSLARGALHKAHQTRRRGQLLPFRCGVSVAASIPQGEVRLLGLEEADEVD